jgi:hypothetical protein
MRRAFETIASRECVKVDLTDTTGGAAKIIRHERKPRSPQGFFPESNDSADGNRLVLRYGGIADVGAE